MKIVKQLLGLDRVGSGAKLKPWGRGLYLVRAVLMFGSTSGSGHPDIHRLSIL